MHAVGFGTGSEREVAHERMHHFFQLVDQGLKDFLKETPLLLAGVHEEVAAYRKVARHHNLLETEIQGNIDFLSPAEIAERASAAALEHYRRAGETVLEKYKEMTDRKRTLGTSRSVRNAALAGRVHQLCIAEEAEDDQGNGVIAETLRHGGEVFMLPRERMPKDVPMAAILRF
jgi:hypothetical protein